jgi:hypothetical protein
LVLATMLRSHRLRQVNRGPVRTVFKTIVGPGTKIQMQFD